VVDCNSIKDSRRLPRGSRGSRHSTIKQLLQTSAVANSNSSLAAGMGAWALLLSKLARRDSRQDMQKQWLD
jgi:hypothetical protein